MHEKHICIECDKCAKVNIENVALEKEVNCVDLQVKRAEMQKLAGNPGCNHKVILWLNI